MKATLILLFFLTFIISIILNIIIHEVGHYAMAKQRGIDAKMSFIPRKVGNGYFVASTEYKTDISFQELPISLILGGALFNLAFGLICLSLGTLLKYEQYNTLAMVFIVSAVLGIFFAISSLIPIGTTDGAMLLKRLRGF